MSLGLPVRRGLGRVLDGWGIGEVPWSWGLEGGSCPQQLKGLTLGPPRVKGLMGTEAIRKVQKMKEPSCGHALGPLVTHGHSYKSPPSSLP